MDQSKPFGHNQPLISWLRSNRILDTQSFGEADSTPQLTVFLGLYNAAGYWADIVANLETQSYKDCHLVIADNASKDGTWDSVINWIPKGFASITKIRNAANVGGAGNFYANLDSVKTPWVTTLHQDDLYYANHLAKHQDLTSRASDRTAIVTTSMDSLGSDSRVPKVAPRVNWVANLATPADVFLTHLRFHAIPFPAASFRTQAFADLEIPWHDTSFPDTETVIKLAADWELSTSPICTMAYRENPESESHAISPRQRQEGQARALVRLFHSAQAERIVRTVCQSDRDGFFRHALESVAMRIPDERLRQEVSLSLAESLAVIWNYGSKSVNAYIQEQMRRAENQFATEFFNFNLSGNVEWPNYLGHGEPAPPTAPEDARSGRHLNTKRWLLRVAFMALHRLGALSWRKDLDFNWRKKP